MTRRNWAWTGRRGGAGGREVDGGRGRGRKEEEGSSEPGSAGGEEDVREVAGVGDAAAGRRRGEDAEQGRDEEA